MRPRPVRRLISGSSLSFRPTSAVFVLLALAAAPAAVQAQGRVDVDASYQVTHGFGSNGGSGMNFPIGFRFGVSDRMSGGLALAGDFGLSHKGTSVGSTSVGETIVLFVGGIRATRQLADGSRLFIEALAGGADIRLAASGFGSTAVAGVAFVPGAGIDVAVAKRAAVRLRGEFGILHRSGSTVKTAQFTVGFALAAQ